MPSESTRAAPATKAMPSPKPKPRLRVASKRERSCAAGLAGWKEEAEHLPCAREDDGGDPAG